MSSREWFRPEILAIPAYVPGKPGDREDVIKLASNEMAYPTLPAVQAVIDAGTGRLNRYPDMFATGLVADIARYHEWPDGGVVVGNGSVALIEKALQALVVPGGEVVLAWRSFEAYPIAIAAAGGRAVRVPLRDGAHDLVGMLRAITPHTRAVLVCSPNNPTGVALTHTELAAFLDQVPESVPVLLDEAYIDFVTMGDAVRSVELLADHPNLVVLRTFSKAYSLAGLRCGYALASTEMAAGLRAVSTPFGVNSLAQEAARAALRSRDEVRRRCGSVVAERDKLVAALAAHGVRVPPTQANFVWLESFGAGFESACAEAGVTVRRFGEEGVRATVAEPEGSLRLLRAVAAVL
ncbi:MAG: histidinol-phosphate transaminase [Actinomycetaceae bacterium]|nr:histidinol-phosphate transaminase [Actinomycetaceae bacterium]